MSVSLWAYTESCDGKPCPGDCDNCHLQIETELGRIETGEDGDA